MPERTTEDRLREEYFELLPGIARVAQGLETEVRHCLIPILRRLERHERVVVASRVKECESALNKLRSKAQSRNFDPAKRDTYTLTELNDLAGVRVSVFPRSQFSVIDRQLRDRFPAFEEDAEYGRDPNRGVKYHGRQFATDIVVGEIQIVPMLTALFWEVEHDAIYKPSPRLKGIAASLSMQLCTEEVLRALKAFEEEFEKVIQDNPLKRLT